MDGEHAGVVLTGRVFLTRGILTAINRPVTYADGAAEEHWPEPGDVRFEMTITAAHRTGKPAGLGLQDRGGRVLAAVLNGVSWERLDLNSLSTVRGFENLNALDGVLRWLCPLVRRAAGLPCVPRLDDEGHRFGFFLAIAKEDGVRSPGVSASLSSVKAAPGRTGGEG